MGGHVHMGAISCGRGGEGYLAREDGPVGAFLYSTFLDVLCCTRNRRAGR